MYLDGFRSLLCVSLLLNACIACPAHFSEKVKSSATVGYGINTSLNTFSARTATVSLGTATHAIPDLPSLSKSSAASSGVASSAVHSIIATSTRIASSLRGSSTPSVIASSVTTVAHQSSASSIHSSSVLIASSSTSSAIPSSSGNPTPDNTCGGTNGYTCNSNDPFGGACCSASGFCGNSDAYCGSGCQPSFGICSSTPGGTVPGLGYFSNFRTYAFESGVFPTDLHRSSYTVPDRANNPNALYDHSFTPDNVAIENGYLVLTVPGGQNTSPILCAEVQTVATNIQYASVRTTAILTQEPGVVDGFFFYHDDCQEIDIEYLPDPASLSNPQGQPVPLQYTNQALSCVQGEGTHTTRSAPADAQTAEHEYRYDWVPGRVDFYTDGVLQDTFTTNVPTDPGAILWNTWTNGDPGFSVGPPVQDAVLRIREIVMYYNTTG